DQRRFVRTGQMPWRRRYRVGALRRSSRNGRQGTPSGIVGVGRRRGGFRSIPLNIDRRDEPETAAVDRADALLKRAVVADCLSRCLDAAAERGLRNAASFPYSVEDLVFRNDALAILDQ